MNRTTNYQLNQWEASDRVLRTDFNSDNAKIDAAIKAETDARTSAVSAINTQLSKKGNCRVWFSRYTGDGLCGDAHPKYIYFPETPILAIVYSLTDKNFTLLVPGTTQGALFGSVYLENLLDWSGNSVGMRAESPIQVMNVDGYQYLVVALFSAS